MTADGFHADAETIRGLANSRGGALIEATTAARGHFDDATASRSSFPEIMSSTGDRLDSVLRSMSDAAADGVRMAEDYRERMLHTAETYDGVEQHNTTSIDGVEV
jgi:hypothetical protein